jgi:TRAP-type C4-dicarboxylate transport system substrate-binding protein
MTANARYHFLFVIAAILCIAIAGCQSATVTDKTGGDVVTLRLATIDKLNPNGQTVAPAAFVRSLLRLSGGRLKATIKTSYELGKPTAETDLVNAIADRTLDGGMPSTRAFGRAGIHGLEASEAPFVITSYVAEKAIVSGPAGEALMHTFDSTKIMGLGLAVGPLRRPFATEKPLVAPDDWRGQTVRTYNSDTQDATVRALGGVPVNASFQFPDLVRAGKLKAVELDIPQYALNSYGTLAPMAARNVVLWPKLLVLAFNRERFQSLTSQQQNWVRQAAAQATKESVDYSYDDTTPAKTLCEEGVRFTDASPAQLTALKSRVAPLIAGLAADPVNGPVLQQIRQVVAAHPGIDAPDVPTTCRTRRTG